MIANPSSINNLLDPIFSSLFDPNPVWFKRIHEEGIKPIRRFLSSPLNQICHLKRRLCRNSFLYGCLDFLAEKQIEYLVVGYGIKHGKSTFITDVEYMTGNQSSVSPSVECLERAKRHISIDAMNEVIMVHNHPQNWINEIFDNLPIPSFKDRETLLFQKILNPFVALRTFISQGTIRLFLIENDFVREFRTPNVLSTIGKISSLFSNMQGEKR